MKDKAINFGIIIVLLMFGLYVRGQNTKAERALCVFRVELQHRQMDDQRSIDRSLKYLADVRAGRRSPVKGITAADVLRGISDKQDTMASRAATIKALSDLNCK